MEKQLGLLDDSAELFFRTIIAKLTGSAHSRNMDFLGKIMEEATGNFSFAIIPKVMNNEEKEALTVYLAWIFNELLYIAVADKNRV